MNNLKKLIEWYENLKEGCLDEIDFYYDEKVFFKDPFNEIAGRENLRKIFVHMFDNLDNPRFVIIDTINNRESVFLTWNFFLKIKGKEIQIDGSSHLKCNKDNKIVYHRDYWDVGEEVLLKIPFIKSLYGLFRNKLALSQ